MTGNPIAHLGSRGIDDLGLVDPVGRLEIVRVVDVDRGVYGRIKVFQQATLLGALVVDQDLVSVVGARNGRSSRSAPRIDM